MPNRGIAIFRIWRTAWERGKSEKEDQTDLKSLLLRFKVDPPLSGLMVDDFALLRLAAIDGLYRAEASA